VKNLWIAGVSALAFSAVAGTALAKGPAGPGPDKKVWDAAQADRADQLKLLETVVNIDSGTGDAEGGRKVEAVLIPILKSLGASVETVPAEAPGLPENVVATFTGTGKGRILMIGHIDTVFGPGTVAERPYRVEGDHARGPGVSDEKGGVIEGLTAMKILHDLGYHDYAKVTFLMETSEERGSPGTQGLIKKLLTDADVEFNLEPGDPPDALTVWRKGSATFHIDVKGRAAHAGIAPQDGRNAIQELIHQIKGLDVYPTFGPATTVNVDVIKGGTRNNIIPDAASAEVNVRVRDQAIFDEVEATMKKDAETRVIPDTTVTVWREAAFPPLRDNAGTMALAARAHAIYAPLGRKLEDSGNGGASESALASAAGVPALDGLGPVGGGFHSEQEYLDLTSLTPRTYLLTKLVMDLGANPPAHK
jgi:glutamate carboxypeptidase